MNKEKSDQASWLASEVLPHEADLRNWLHSRFSSIQDVDDLVQEALTRILKAKDSGPIVNPRAYLFVVARNIALNQIRHMHYERPEGAKEMDPLSIVDDITNPSEQAAINEEIEHLVKAIKSLPRRCRQVMTLRKIYGFSQKEVARKLGISVNTVEVQYGIAMRKCIHYFRQHGYTRLRR